MNYSPTQGLERNNKEHLRFQRTNQMLHESNARVSELTNCCNQTLWVESALVAQWTLHWNQEMNKKIQGGCICISSMLEAKNPLKIDKGRLKDEGEEESKGIGEAKVAHIECRQC